VVVEVVEDKMIVAVLEAALNEVESKESEEIILAVREVKL
jgi:hypothetical protein